MAENQTTLLARPKVRPDMDVLWRNATIALARTFPMGRDFSSESAAEDSEKEKDNIVKRPR